MMKWRCMNFGSLQPNKSILLYSPTTRSSILRSINDEGEADCAKVLSNSISTIIWNAESLRWWSQWSVFNFRTTLTNVNRWNRLCVGTRLHQAFQPSLCLTISIQQWSFVFLSLSSGGQPSRGGGARALWFLRTLRMGYDLQKESWRQPCRTGRWWPASGTASNQHGVHYLSVSIKRLLIRFFEMTS